MPSITSPFVEAPPRYPIDSLTLFDPKVSPAAAKALEAAQAYLAARIAEVDNEDVGLTPCNLVMIGPPGVGKTMLAVGVFEAEVQHGSRLYDEARERYADALAEFERLDAAWWALSAEERRSRIEGGAKRLISPAPPRRAPTPRWVNVPAALVDMRREFGRDDQPITDALHDLRDTWQTVVLDDLGREKASDWTAEVLYVLVNDRYEHRMPTIVTSNLTREELVSSGYWPVISRLAEDGLMIEVKSPDRRLVRR